MALEGMRKFNRIMALYFGGLIGVVVLIYVIYSLVIGKSVSLSNLIFMFVAFSGAVWGYKELYRKASE